MEGMLRVYREWRLLLLLLLLMGLFRSAIADWYTVPTGSMKPTIVEGDRIFVNKMAYGLRIPFTTYAVMQWDDPGRGDIIVFQSDAAEKRLVKRVIGIAGDVIMLRQNRLYVNGVAAQYSEVVQKTADIGWADEQVQPLILDEAIDGYLHEVALARFDVDFGPVQVPADHLFVMGDNRDYSADSRYYGFVPRSEVLGQARGVIVSLNPEHYYLPRDGRSLLPFDSH